MKRKDKHLNKYLNEPLPDPEIPADDAWAGMSDMLDAAESHGAGGQGQFSQIWKSLGKLKGLLVAASALVITSVVVLLIVLNAETKDQKSTKIQSISSNIQDSALAKTATQRPDLQPDTNHIHPTIPSEAAPPEVATAPSPIAPTEPVIPENERIEVQGRHSPTVAASSRDAHTGRTRTGDTRTYDARKENGTHTDGSRTDGTGSTRASVTRIRDTPNSANAGANGRGTFFGSATRQTEAASPTNRLDAAKTPQEAIPSLSLEKNARATLVPMSLNSLKPRAGRFERRNNDLGKLVKKPNVVNEPQPTVKARSSLWEGIRFGPEWNINRSVVSTDYMFTNADSVKRPVRLAIPGVFVSKTWNRHTATFIFNPLHSYFGDKERVAQRLDTVRISDSTHFVNRYNTNFVKSFGMNFSLQYQYRVASLFSLMGGVSYAKYSSALLFREVEYPTGIIVMEKHLAAKGQDVLKSYIRPHQWNIRAGILFHSPDVFNNRLQVALTTIVPVSKLSLNGFKSVKTPNIQMSVRFLVR
jgi:hypothetical protein